MQANAGIISQVTVTLNFSYYTVSFNLYLLSVQHISTHHYSISNTPVFASNHCSLSLQ